MTEMALRPARNLHRIGRCAKIRGDGRPWMITDYDFAGSFKVSCPDGDRLEFPARTSLRWKKSRLPAPSA